MWNLSPPRRASAVFRYRLFPTAAHILREVKRVLAFSHTVALPKALRRSDAILSDRPFVRTTGTGSRVRHRRQQLDAMEHHARPHGARRALSHRRRIGAR